MNLIRTATLTMSAAAILGLAACSSTTTQPSQSSSNGSTSTAPSGTAAKGQDKALVRFLNATPDPKDLSFGETPAFSNIAPLAASSYAELPAERREFKLYAAGSDTGTPLATNNDSPFAGKHYTIVAMNGPDGTPTLSPISDDLVQPDPGKAKVRVIDAAPGVKKVDVYPVGGKALGNKALGNKALIDGIDFKEATGYKEVDPILTEIDVRTGGSKTSVLKVRNLNLAPGKLYTLVVMGGNGQPLTSNVIEDRLLQDVASAR